MGLKNIIDNDKEGRISSKASKITQGPFQYLRLRYTMTKEIFGSPNQT